MFLYYISECLKNPDLEVAPRSLAGILFKNTVLNTTKDDECHELWYNMTAEERDTLKNSLLEALGDLDSNIIRSAATAISAVCFLEIPQNRWPEVLEILCTNIQHEMEHIRQASLLTLGYICEELAKGELKKEQSDFVISAFLDSVDKNQDNTETMKQTIQGLYHSVKFAYPHFEMGQGRIFVDKVLICLGHNDVEVRIIAMQCIVEIVRFFEDHLQPFMEDIMDVTFKIAKSDEKEVTTQAIEVWASICEEELARNRKKIPHHGLIETALSSLLEILMHAIQQLNIGNDDDDDQEWGASIAAGCCLSLVSQVVGDHVVEQITIFAGENITKPTWENRY
jgi:importin subunit beta-1